MNLPRSGLKLFLGRIGSTIIQFAGITFFARELGASSMGVFFLFEALLGMLLIPANFGLRGAVEKRISEGESQDRFVTSAILAKTIPLVLIASGIILLSPHINRYVGANVSILLILVILARDSAFLTIAILKGELRVGETAILRFGRRIIWVAVGSIFVLSGYGAKGLIYGLLVAYSTIFVWGWWKCSISLGKPSLTHIRSLVNYGKYNVVSSIGGYIYGWMDVAIIGFFLTQAHVGAYEIAWRVTMIVMLLSRSIASVLFPQISHLEIEDAYHKIESIIQKALLPSMILVIPSFFGVLILSQEILYFVFGQSYTIASIALIVLMGEKIFQSVHAILGKSLQGIDHPDLAAKATVVAVFANLVLNIALIPRFGIVGAAVATTISFLFNSILHGYFLSHYIEIKFPKRKIAWCVASSIIMYVVISMFSSLFGIDKIYELISLIALGAIIYFSIIAFNRKLRHELFELAKKALSK